MPVSATAVVRLACDKCGQPGRVVGEHKKAADAAARRAGWLFDHAADTALCIRCRPRTYTHGTSWKQRELEQRYGLPFWTLVEQYAQKGLSMTVAGELLGYRRRTFTGLLERHGRKSLFHVDGSGSKR